LGHAAQLEDGAAPRLRGVQAGVSQLGDAAEQVVFELAVQVLLEAAAAPGQEVEKPGHVSLPR
jgi:hypothetical protein